jgi:hypothetical protein
MNAPADARLSDRPKAGAMKRFKSSSATFQSITAPLHSETDIAHLSVEMID